MGDVPERPVLPGSRKAQVGEGSDLPAEAAPGGPWDEAMRLAPLDDDELAELTGEPVSEGLPCEPSGHDSSWCRIHGSAFMAGERRCFRSTL